MTPAAAARSGPSARNAIVGARAGEADHPRLTYRPELDGIRGIAILLVLAGHARLFGEPYAGQVGVTLFFVLSGYLITGLLRAELDATGGVSLRRFYARRARRLLPALVAVVAATGVLMLIVGGSGNYPVQAAASLFYTANIAYASGVDMGYLQHTWSLSLEEQFYLVWPALFLLFRGRWLIAGVVIGIVASTLVRLSFAGEPFAPASFRPDLRVDAVLWGCLVALVPLRLPRWAPVVGWLVVVFLVVVPWPTALGLPAAALASVLVLGEGLRWRGLVRVGQLSYGLYLWHFAPALLLAPLTIAGDHLAQAALFVTAFALALVSERWIERPWRTQRPRSRGRPGHTFVMRMNAGAAAAPPAPPPIVPVPADTHALMR